MTFDPNFLDLMNTVAQYLPADGTMDRYGAVQTDHPGLLVPCRVRFKTTIQRGNTEDSQASNCTVWMPPGEYVWNSARGTVIMPTAAAQDKMVLPDGIERFILWIDIPYDENGSAAHQVLYLD
jgi:hypothetical protein